MKTAPSAQADDLPINYGTIKFKMDVRNAISELAANDPTLDRKAQATRDRGGQMVAEQKHTDRGTLAWHAVSVDLTFEQRQSNQKFNSALKFERMNPVLTNFPELPPLDIPEKMVIDDEMVKKGDPRMTLQAMLDTAQSNLDCLTKDLEALEFRAAVFRKAVEETKTRIEGYEAWAEAFRKDLHVEPKDVIYDAKKKSLVARKGAKRSA